ncbi:helix-turn-helix transcriptional regulator [bacterium]|nr:helix-turn-helix transcriptional regulator [bacterium]
MRAGENESESGIWARRCAVVVGMAAMWTFVHNQLMFPVIFAYGKQGAPSAIALYLVYAIPFLAFCAFIALNCERLERGAYESPRAMAALGLVGVLGSALVCFAGFTSTASSVLSAAGIALMAGFVPVYVAFWCTRLVALGDGSLAQAHVVAIACAASYLVFCVITGVRLSLGLHASHFTIACALVTTVLAVACARRAPVETCACSLAPRQLPLNVVLPAVAFVLVSVAIISMLNPPAATTSYPPSRAPLYWIGAALMAVVIAVHLANRGTGRRAGVIVFTLLSAYLVGMILLTAVSAMQSFRTSNFPVIAGKNALDVFVLLCVLTSAHNKHASPTRLVALYLAVVVEASDLASALVLALSGSLHGDLAGNPVVLGAMLGAAFLVTVVADVILTLFLTRRERTARRLRLVHEQAGEASAPGVTDWMGPANDEAALRQARAVWRLTDREMDVLRAVCANASTQRIARELGISDATVYSHLKRIYQKAGVHSRQDLVDLVETLGK